MKAGVRNLLTGSGTPPSVVSAITTPLTGTNAGSTSTASLSLALPTGYASGDFAIIATYSANTLTTPTGWTLSGISSGFFFKVLDGTEAATVALAQTAGYLVAACQIFRHVNSTTQIESTSASKTTFSGTSLPTNNVTATANDTTAVAFAKGQLGSGSPTFTAPAGFTLQAQGSISLHGVAIASKIGPLSSGAGLTATFTCSASVSSGRGDLWLLKSA